MKPTKLISGTFTPDDAREILLEMVNCKINFHNIKVLRSLVSYNQPDSVSEERIQELKQAKEELLAIIQKAKDENIDLHIESLIHISYEAKGEQKEFGLQENLGKKLTLQAGSNYRNN